MYRREFLAALTVAPLAAQDRIRIAFLGANHPHGPAKVEVVRQNAAFELAGICETDAAHRARYEKAGIKMLTRSQILDDRTIQAVVVDSRVPDHAADAIAALSAGKHVHLEKPPAADLAGLRRQVELARQHRVLLQMGYMWRHHPGINAALEAARQGWLGDVHFVRGTINTLIAAEERREVARFPGGQMFELGCHLIDPLIRLLGAPTKVKTVLKELGADGLADNTVAVFEFAHALATIQTSSLQPGASRHRAFEIFGSNGCAIVRPIEPPQLEIDLAKAAGPYQAKLQKVDMPEYHRYLADFVEFAGAIRSGKPLPVRLEDEIVVQQALLAASAMV
jgi:predicted dehydrogenase